MSNQSDDKKNLKKISESNKFDRRKFLKSGSIVAVTGILQSLFPQRAKAMIGFMMRLNIKNNSIQKLYVDNVFSANLVGAGVTTIDNGLNFSEKGGMVWSIDRTSSGPQRLMQDTLRSATIKLATNSNAPQGNNGYHVLSFLTSGYTFGEDNGRKDIVYSFIKNKNFFDMMTYTGDGTTDGSKVLSHSLGLTPSLIIVKRLDIAGDWIVFGLSTVEIAMDVQSYMKLNTTDSMAALGTSLFNADTSSLKPRGSVINTNGASYVAYLFGSDPTTDGIIGCGNYTGNGSASGPIVNLSWEPQWVMIKNANGVGSWQILDNMRGMSVGSADTALQANQAVGESSVDYINPTASGFQVVSTSSEVNSSGSKYIYMAIRRSHKPPSSGTQVYNAITRTGTGAAAAVTGLGFSPDLVIGKSRANASRSFGMIDKLRGLTNTMTISANGDSTVDNAMISFDADGFTVGADSTVTGSFNSNGETIMNWAFRRAAQVFDIVCYVGDGNGNVARNHNLGAIPEMVMIKARTGSTSLSYSWVTYHSAIGLGKGVSLRLTDAVQGYWNTLNTIGTETTFTPQATTYLNIAGDKYVAYLFSSKAGVSKVGSYTGTASGTVEVPCGFTGSARFILIKRTDATGDWIIVDSTRGSGVYSTLNTSAAEVSTSVVSFTAGGFTTAASGAITNASSSATYIFLAFA